jgi:hypothetical protein
VPTRLATDLVIEAIIITAIIMAPDTDLAGMINAGTEPITTAGEADTVTGLDGAMTIAVADMVEASGNTRISTTTIGVAAVAGSGECEDSLE